MSGFENFGVRQDIGEQARMECGICWTVYDPEPGRSGGADPARYAVRRAAGALDLSELRRAQSKFMMVEGET